MNASELIPFLLRSDRRDIHLLPGWRVVPLDKGIVSVPSFGVSPDDGAILVAGLVRKSRLLRQRHAASLGKCIVCLLRAWRSYAIHVRRPCILRRANNASTATFLGLSYDYVSIVTTFPLVLFWRRSQPTEGSPLELRPSPLRLPRRILPRPEYSVQGFHQEAC